jgi:hypothetical protein
MWDSLSVQQDRQIAGTEMRFIRSNWPYVKLVILLGSHITV